MNWTVKKGKNICMFSSINHFSFFSSCSQLLSMDAQ